MVEEERETKIHKKNSHTRTVYIYGKEVKTVRSIIKTPS